MRTPRKRPTRCRRCDGWSADIGPISFRGLCEPCAMELQLRHNRSLADKQGPEYEAWLLACAEALVPRWQAAIDQGAALKGGGTSDPSAAPRTP